MKFEFECVSGCSNCCRLSDGFVFLTEKEVENIAAYLQKSADDIYRWFIKRLDERLCLVDGEDEHCIFLENDRCIIYPVRPQQCRDYPFWPEITASEERWIQEKSVCPGIKIHKKKFIEQHDSSGKETASDS
jgi:Fe-S-cluster containining protein